MTRIKLSTTFWKGKKSCNGVQSIFGRQLKPAALGAVVLRKTASKRSRAFRIVWTSRSRGLGNCTEIKHHSFSILFILGWQVQCEATRNCMISARLNWFQPFMIFVFFCLISFHGYVMYCYVISCWSVWNRQASDNSPIFRSTNHPSMRPWGDHLWSSSRFPLLKHTSILRLYLPFNCIKDLRRHLPGILGQAWASLGEASSFWQANKIHKIKQPRVSHVWGKLRNGKLGRPGRILILGNHTKIAVPLNYI